LPKENAAPQSIAGSIYPLRKFLNFVALIVTMLVSGGWAFPSTGFAQTVQPTRPSPSFTFTAAGDYGFNKDSAATLEAISREKPNFHLALGDLKYKNDLSENDWCDFVKSKVGKKFPFQLVAGNHEDDYGEDGRITKFAECLPDRIGVKGKYARDYYFDYRKLARFIMISPDLTIKGRHYYYGQSNADYKRIAKLIDEARAKNIPWVIVGMHKSCLSMGAYYCRIYADLLNLLVEKKVDLILQAHEHNYQRSKQLSLNAACPTIEVDSYSARCVADDGADDVYNKGAGSVFVISGAAGADLYDINLADPEAGYFAKWMGANATPTKGFMRFTVTATQLSAEFINSTSTSTFTDKFTISKPEPRSGI
jgi:hypothetical protein